MKRLPEGFYDRVVELAERKNISRGLRNVVNIIKQNKDDIENYILSLPFKNNNVSIYTLFTILGYDKTTIVEYLSSSLPQDRSDEINSIDGYLPDNFWNVACEFHTDWKVPRLGIHFLFEDESVSNKMYDIIMNHRTNELLDHFYCHMSDIQVTHIIMSLGYDRKETEKVIRKNNERNLIIKRP